VFVRLTKFNKSVDECESFQDKLLFTLCNAHKLEEKPKQLEGKQFDDLFELARISNFDTEELAQYEANRMNMLDYNASIKFAKKEGVAKGLLQTARNMKAKGFNTAVICEVTGLSEAEVEGLD
jgi:predicted transposase/invertase (TIGR01784 family)